VIKPTLNILVQDLNAFLNAELGLNNPIVLSNVADENLSPTTGSDQIFLTLVGMEEETVLKNSNQHNSSLAPGDKQLPPMRLNLYVLFSFKSDDYGEALDALSRLMGYCQAKKIWNQQNTPVPAFSTLTYQNFYFTLDMYNISFEDSNNMWGNLGGKQLPFVIYKLRLVALTEPYIHSTSGLITNTITNSNGN